MTKSLTVEVMAHIATRTWPNKDGSIGKGYTVTYVDSHGTTQRRQFDNMKDAKAYRTKVEHELSQGLHTTPSKSLTIAEVAGRWLKSVEANGREPTTLYQYTSHVKLHIVPRIGKVKVYQLTTPSVHAFKEQLLLDLSRKMARKVLRSFKSLLKYAQITGLVAQNVAQPVRIEVDNRKDKQRKLEIGVDIPTTADVKAMIDGAYDDRARVSLITAAWSGLRPSELRALRWADVNLKDAKITVAQRADRYGTIGHPKSHSSERTLPIPDFVVNRLKAWKLECPPSDLDLVFPTRAGRLEEHKNLTVRVMWRAQIKAGLVDKHGKPKYGGLKSLRHFYASFCINRKRDGGLELPPIVVQHRLGHSSIVMTMDRYGHLFPSQDDGREMNEAVNAIFAVA
jgi:integrase